MKLFCSHNYKNMCRSADGIWSIFECLKCGKLLKGGMPRTTIKIHPPPVRDINSFGWSLNGLDQCNPESKNYIGKKCKKKSKKKGKKK